MDKDGDLVVQVSGQSKGWTLNPECCVKTGDDAESDDDDDNPIEALTSLTSRLT